MYPSMNTTQTLPQHYRLSAEVSMQNHGLLVRLNLIGLLLVVVFGWLFSAAAFWLRPNEAAAALSFSFGGADALWTVVVVLLITFVTIVFHEVVHGLGFLFIGRVRPTFGFRWVYAYAAAPGSYIPRNRYLPIALAPLVVISILIVAMMVLVPARWLTALVLMGVINSAGAVADIWVVWLLLRRPPETLAHDQGDKIGLYVPEERTS